jgi:type II secretory pathway predicted ATPase ExeA
LRCFAKSIDRNLFEVVYLCLATVSLPEFYKQFCAALGIDVPHGKPAMFRAIQDRLYHLFKEKRKPLIVLHDEAHELSTPILNDLKMVMNHDFDSVNCFSLVLAGELHLNKTLNKNIHEALRQRVTIHYTFNGLDDAETELYIKHKLRNGGAVESILGDGTMPAIVGYACGCPRLVDNLMNEILKLGAQLERHTIDTELVMAAVNNLTLV